MALVIYYNTLCPICDGGITRFKRRMIDLVKSGAVEYRDINLEPERLAEFGASLEDIRKKLHALDNGNLLIGVDVVVAIFKRTPGRRWAGHLLALPIIHSIGNLGYHILAEVLYDWNRRKGHW